MVVVKAAEAVFLFAFSTSCSLCQRRQLKFSNLLPCSTESAQREKTVAPVGQHRGGCSLVVAKEDLPVHML